MTTEGPQSGGGAADPAAPDERTAEPEPQPELAPSLEPLEPLGPPKPLPIAPDVARRIDSMVASFVDGVSSVDVHSPEYRRRVDEIDRLGERELVATSQMTGRLLQRPIGAAEAILEGSVPLARTLADLRRTVEELNPARYDLTEPETRRLRGIVPRRDRLEAYFDRYGKARAHLEAIVAALALGRSELERDNAAIAQEQRALTTEMETLRQYAFMAQRLDEELERRIATIAATDAGRVQALREDVLFAVRRRRQEILTHLAVTTQGYAALAVVERNNVEVIRAIATATTTTVAALRTAVVVAQAAASRRLVTRQVAAVRELASSVTDTAAAMLRDETVSVETGGRGSGADLASLQRAWDGVFAALDEIDSYKRRAEVELQATVEDVSKAMTSGRNRNRDREQR